jgi:hypothetical protein
LEVCRAVIGSDHHQKILGVFHTIIYIEEKEDHMEDNLSLSIFTVASMFYLTLTLVIFAINTHFQFKAIKTANVNKTTSKPASPAPPPAASAPQGQTQSSSK